MLTIYEACEGDKSTEGNFLAGPAWPLLQPTLSGLLKAQRLSLSHLGWPLAWDGATMGQGGSNTHRNWLGEVAERTGWDLSFEGPCCCPQDERVPLSGPFKRPCSAPRFLPYPVPPAVSVLTPSCTDALSISFQPQSGLDPEPPVSTGTLKYSRGPGSPKPWAAPSLFQPSLTHFQ